MNKIIIIYIVFPFFAWSGFLQSIWCQNYTVQKDSIQYQIQTSQNDVSNYYILSYKIVSKSDSIIWLWFEEKNNLCEDKKLKEYFFRNKGDINLFHILTDANVSVQGTVPILFNTFLKYINAHDSFMIQIICTEENFRKKEAIFNYLDEHLVIESNKTLSKFLGINNLTEWKRIKFYEEDFIILPIKLFDFQ